LNIKLKGPHFDTIEVMEAESQAVLNTLTEHDFQDAFKKMAETLGTVHTHGKGLIRGI
jgi:predicted helicase